MLSAPLIITVLALCVDVSLRRLVSDELQQAADAAAIAGAESLAEAAGSADTAIAAAQALATASGNKTTLGTIAPGATVEVGAWNPDTRTFGAAGNSPADAVRIIIKRSAATNNATPSILSQVFDNTNSKVTSRTSIARVEKIPDYALIGLDSFKAKGLLVISSYPVSDQGSIASNGNVDLNLLGLVGVTLMDGQIATRGVVNAPTIGILTKIKHGVTRPDKPFVLPPISTDFVANNNDNASLGALLSGSGNLNIGVYAEVPGGTYYVKNLNVLTGAFVKFMGPVTIYVQNDVNVLGAMQVFNNDPGNFKVRVAGTGAVTIAANVAMAADIYAPKAAAIVAAGVSYTGRLIAKTVDVAGTGIFTLKTTLPQPELGRSRVAVVE